MKLRLLGTGTPRPTVRRQCTANLVQIGDTNILFDAGRGASTQLAKIGVAPRAIDYIFITHHHFDHIGNLDDVLLAAWNDGRKTPIHVFGPPGTNKILDHMFNEIYARDIDFRQKESAFHGGDLPDFKDILIAQDLRPHGGSMNRIFEISCEPVEHGHAIGLSHTDWPCFGYRIEAEGKTLAISGDTIDCKGVRTLAQNADLLLQCCYMAEAEIETVEMRLLADHILASAKQANNIARAAKVSKMVLTHLSPKSDIMLAAVLAEASEGFNGDVIIGEDLMSFNI